MFNFIRKIDEMKARKENIKRLILKKDKNEKCI